MEEKTLLKAVIVFPLRRRSVLLAKKAEKIGAGCWNGYGGGIVESETAIDFTTEVSATEPARTLVTGPCT